MSKDLEIVFAGFLLQKSVNVFSKKWTKVYVKIRRGIIYIYSNKESKIPNHFGDLANYSIQITPIRNKPPYWVFELLPIQEFSSMKPLKFGASSADEMNSCLEIFQKGIDLSRKISIEENNKTDKSSIKSNLPLQRKLTNANSIIDDTYENQNEIKKHKSKSKSLKITGNNLEFRNSSKYINIEQNSPQHLLPDTTCYDSFVYENNDNSETNKEIYDTADDTSNINVFNSNLLDSNELNNIPIYFNENNDRLNIDSVDGENNNKSIIDCNPKLRMNVSENPCVSYETENAENEIKCNKNIPNILQIDLKHKSISEDISRLVEKEIQHRDLSIYASYSENSNQNRNYSFSGTIEIETEIEDKSIYDTNDENNVDILNVPKLKSEEDLSVYANYNTCDIESYNDNIDDNETVKQTHSLENVQTEFQQEDLSLYANYNTSNLTNNNETVKQTHSLDNAQTELQQEDLSLYADYNTSNLTNNNDNIDDKTVGQRYSLKNVQTEFQQEDLSLYADFNTSNLTNNNETVKQTHSLDNAQTEFQQEDLSLYADYNTSNLTNNNDNIDDKTVGQRYSLENVQTEFQQEDLSMYADYNTSNLKNNNDNIDDNETVKQTHSLDNPESEFQQEDLSMYANYNTSNLTNNNDNIDDKTVGQIYSLDNPESEFQQEDLSMCADCNISNLENNNKNEFEKYKINSTNLQPFENNSNRTENLQILPQTKIPTKDFSHYSTFIENQSHKINFKNVLFIGNSEEAYKALSEYYLLGSFLVRIDNGKQILTVQSEEYIVKYILVYNSNNNKIGIKDQKVQFENLEDLLLYYIDNNLPRRNFKLTVPYKICGNT